MIVQVSKTTNTSRTTFVIDWDRKPAPWNEIGPEIATSLDLLSRRGANWSTVKNDTTPLYRHVKGGKGNVV
jgi:hypothetical protein